MRELKRSIARAKMRDAGCKRINKKNRTGKSFFATYWKLILELPEDEKALKNELAKIS